MKKFEKESNGHNLSIIIDEEKLNTLIDERIKNYQSIVGKDITNDEEGWDLIHEYHLQTVYGDPESDYHTAEEVIKDCNDFKSLINRLATGDGKELWDKVSLKKNGTFKLNAKPILKEAINGSYWQDSYGWHTLVLRLVPCSDKEMQIEFNYVTLHY